jgi:hypothetical protein
MLTFDMGPLAERLGCEAEVAAYTGPFIGWRFLAEMLHEMPVPDGEAKAVVDPVIAGMNLLAAGKNWPKAAADAARAARGKWWARTARAARAADAAWAARAAWAADAADAAWAANAAAWAAAAGAAAGLSFPHQRDILLRLIEEANE